MEGDPEVFYECSRLCLRTADRLQGQFEQLDRAAATCTGAGGTDSAGRAWSARHDAAANELFTFLYESMIPALDHYAALLITVGYNQAIGDHRATHTPGAAEPVRPDLPSERGLGSLRLITTGHGTGHGVVDNGVGFAASVGHLVSDANKADLLRLATAWRDASDEDVTTELRSATAIAREVDADEARGAVEDIEDLIGVLETCRRQTTRLETYCSEQLDEVVELRESRLPQLLRANAAALGVVEVAPRDDALAVVFRPSGLSFPLEEFTSLVVDDLQLRQTHRLAEIDRFEAEDISEQRRITDDINSRPIAEMPDSAPTGNSSGAPDEQGSKGPPMRIDDKQFGRKIGKHAQDFGLDPSDPSVRVWLRQHFEDVRNSPDEVRCGPYHPSVGGGSDYWFYRKGNDVLITKGDGEFVTCFPMNGSNSWFDAAVPQ